MSTLGQLIGILFVVGLIIRYFWWIAAVVAVVAVIKRAPSWWAQHQAVVDAERDRLAAIATRADQQHAWTLAGDPRGTYGAEITRRD
jgi:uncharacterized membrane protein (Fun14 family)